MKPTKLVYLTDSYQQTVTATVIDVANQSGRTGLVLDQTIFYPQGGGQPSDVGDITTPHATLSVSQVDYHDGHPIHWGKAVQGTFKKNDSVTLSINWDRRFHNMRLHSAGHLLHEAVMQVALGIEPVSGIHGIGGRNQLKYKGIIDHTLLPSIQTKLNALLDQNIEITTKMVTLKKLQEEASWVPENLPKNKPLRIVQIKGFEPLPDGGTQVKSTQEIGAVTITDIDYEDHHSIVKYAVASDVKKPNLVQPSTNSFSDFKKLFDTVAAEIQTIATTKTDPEKTRVTFLGRHGKINELTKLIRSLPEKDRGPAGQKLNQLKSALETLIHQKWGQRQAPTGAWLDVTMPGEKPSLGHLHPITQAIMEITRIFGRIGFTRVRHPEVDWDWYAFESLNMPPNHPARDEWETFFIKSPNVQNYYTPDVKRLRTSGVSKKGQMILTPHTSNGQVREMEKGNVPIRMINIARCYRRQSDVSHTPMFHQFEGMYIDTSVSIAHLKGVFDYFVKQFYGADRKIRLRPFHFQFTEPSFEVDITCDICNGTGRVGRQKCRLCKGGWLEMAGSGMIHPVVLQNGGIDPEKYSGFAFGWGVERAYMMKAGIKIDDLRLIYSNNLRFLEQF